MSVGTAAMKAVKTKSTGFTSDLLDGMDTLEMLGEQKAEEKFSGETRLSRAAQTSTILTVVTLGITILVGILIYGEVQDSLPSPSNSDLSNASTNATNDFADAMELAPVIMIVLLASVVLAVVQRFR